MKRILKYGNMALWMAGVVSVLFMNACLDDLNQTPPKDKSKGDLLNAEGSQSLLAKIYTGFSLSGIKGPSGDDKLGENDLVAADGDQGSLVFLRGLITMQEFPTDEAIWNWKDPGIEELINTNWTFTTKYAYTFYQRCMLNIRYCKEFLDMFPADSDIPNIQQMRDEIRGIRAINYYYLIDIYGNPGVIWDDSPTSDVTWLPEPIGRKALFDKITAELELLANSAYLSETPSQATYGRVTKPVIWTVLAKMYLNAEVYAGTAMYDKAATNCDKVMNVYPTSGLEPNYANLFCGDNDQCIGEIIFAIPFDETNVQSYGSTILLTFGAYGGALNPNWLGCNGSWTCLKAKETLISKFDGAPSAGEGKFKNNIKKDQRYLFFDIESYKPMSGTDTSWPFDETGKIVFEVDKRRVPQVKMEDWNAGYLSYKFNNLKRDGARASSANNPNTDFPLFRLADIYLMYAECAVRGAAGTDINKAVNLVNSLRARAYGDNSGNITAVQLQAPSFILDERARELYWEGHRRSDLIRYKQFTKEYNWPYKGGTPEGVADVDDKFNLYPISDKDLTSNPKLVQNTGYESLNK